MKAIFLHNEVIFICDILEESTLDSFPYTIMHGKSQARLLKALVVVPQFKSF